MKRTAYSIVLIAAALVLGGCVEPYGYTETTYRTGYEIRTLPPGHRTVVIDGTRYYTHNDTYFRPRGNTYVVVEPPRRGYRDRDHDYRDHDRHYGPDRYRPGTVVRTLPDGYRRVTRRGTTYYQYNDYYFRPHADGYVVVDYR